MNSDIIQREKADSLQTHSSRPLRVALTGNPNSGKTSLFNQITGAHQKVGNWSGVTVEIKEGTTQVRGENVTVIDLPGTYSLSTQSIDERVARDFLIHEKPDVVIDVIDATNLDRHLYLTVQLLELGIQPILALNMWDEVKAKGVKINTDLLSGLLGLPVVFTNGRTGDGIKTLLETAYVNHDSFQKQSPHFSMRFPGELENIIRKLEQMLKSSGGFSHNPRWGAIQLLEMDKAVEDEVGKNVDGKQVLAFRDKCISELKEILGDDPQTRIAEERYGFIAGAIKETVQYPAMNRVDASEKIDAVLTHRFWAYPIFLLFMWLLFQATFKIGEYPMGWIESLFEWLGRSVAEILPAGIFRDLLIDGAIAGVGGVIIFLPNILILFLGISIMEDTGYMARAAFITDNLMHRIGLHGKSFIPMLMGMGCSVPAIMAARTLESPRDRIKTILLTPLISCSARLPVFVLFAGALFPKQAGNVVFLFQIVLSFGAFIFMAFLFKHTLFRKTQDYPFVMELPPYRMPTLRSIVIHMWQKTEHYLKKMGGVVLLFSVVLWWAGVFPKSPAIESLFDSKIAAVRSSTDIDEKERSLLVRTLENEKNAAVMEQTWIGRAGKLIEPVVMPFGTDWRGGVSLVTGFVAKEIVVGSMGVLYAAGDGDGEESEGLRERIRDIFTPLSAFAFMLFVLLYTPCLVALVTVFRELKNLKWSIFSLVYQLTFAWTAATLVFQAGRLLGVK